MGHKNKRKREKDDASETSKSRKKRRGKSSEKSTEEDPEQVLSGKITTDVTESKKKRREKKSGGREQGDSKKSKREKSSKRSKSKKKKHRKKSKESSKSKKTKREPSSSSEGSDSDEEDDTAFIAQLKKDAAMAAQSPQPGMSGRVHTPVGQPVPVASEPNPVQRPEELANEEDDCRLFVGNLSFHVTEDDIYKKFEECGEIANIHWVTDKTTGKFYGTSFVRFKNPDAAAAAVEFNGRKLLGRELKIHYAKGVSRKKKATPTYQQMERPIGCNTMFVGLLPYDTTDDDIWSIFSHCGEISSVRYVTDPHTEEFKCCCFVEFADEKSTIAAGKLNETELRGKNIRVDYVKPKEEEKQY